MTLHALPPFPFSRVAQARPSDPLWMGPNWNFFFQVSLTENDNGERRKMGGKEGTEREQ